MGDSEVRLRRAEPGDMASIVELWRKLSEERAKADRRYAIRSDAPSIWEEWARERLRDESSIVLVAQDGDDYIGYLVGYVAESKPIREDLGPVHLAGVQAEAYRDEAGRGGRAVLQGPGTQVRLHQRPGGVRPVLRLLREARVRRRHRPQQSHRHGDVEAAPRSCSRSEGVDLTAPRSLLPNGTHRVGRAITCPAASSGSQGRY